MNLVQRTTCSQCSSTGHAVGEDRRRHPESVELRPQSLAALQVDSGAPRPLLPATRRDGPDPLRELRGELANCARSSWIMARSSSAYWGRIGLLLGLLPNILQLFQRNCIGFSQSADRCFDRCGSPSGRDGGFVWRSPGNLTWNSWLWLPLLRRLVDHDPCLDTCHDPWQQIDVHQATAPEEVEAPSRAAPTGGSIPHRAIFAEHHVPFLRTILTENECQNIHTRAFR